MRAAAEPYLLPPHGWWLRAQVSREAPLPLPGGYKLGEKVFYNGPSKTFPSGNKLVHDQEGEVTGPAVSESHRSKGVVVLFPGNKGSINLSLLSVRRLRAAPTCDPPRRVHRSGARPILTRSGFC